MEHRDAPRTGSSDLSRSAHEERAKPIYSPDELRRAEQPPGWRALGGRAAGNPVWRYVQGSFAGQVTLRFLNDWGGRDATLIAWAGLVSLLPLLIVVPIVTIAVLRLMGVDISNGEQEVLTTLIPGGPLRSVLVQALREVSRHTAVLSVVAGFGLLWRGTALFRQLEMCLSRIAGVRPRPFLRRLVLSVVLLCLIGLVSLGTAAATVFFFATHELEFLSHPLATSVAALGGQVVIGLVIGFGVFMFIYGVIPNHAYRIRQVWPGALFATICFELLSLLFPLWAAMNRNFGTYGTELALVIVLIAYFYLFGVIVVVGADLNAVLWGRTPAPHEGEVTGS